MRTRVLAVAVTCLLISMKASGAAPDGVATTSLTTFRVTSAEVHLTFTAARAKNLAVSNLSASDFVVLRDGSPIDQIVSFQPYHEAPLSVLVLSDVSDSMVKGIPLERVASQWLRSSSDPSRDRLLFLDFDDQLQGNRSRVSGHMTSLYDALIETLPRIAANGIGRRALILLSDGVDNDSYHSLTEVITTAQRFDVAIYAITAHPGKKQFYQADVLQVLCGETGGRFYEVRKPEAMTSAIAEINDELRNGYELIFRPEHVKPGMHQISIRPNQRGMHFYYRSAYFQPAVAVDEVAAK